METPEVEQIKTFLKTLMKEYKIPGASVAIVHEGEVILAEGFGVTDLISKEPVNDRTKFGIASLTKGFTTALLAAVLPFHGITWDTPLSKIFEDVCPNFHFGDNYMTQKACLRDLLTHKMGIDLGGSDVSWMCNSLSKEKLLSKVQHIPLSPVGFRTKFMYNNFMYCLAAKVIEVLTGSSWEDRIRERFFDILGMEDASFLHEEGDNTPNFARPHMLVNGIPTEIPMELNRASTCIAAGGSICCSAQDMTKWMQFLLDDGKLFGTPIIPTRQLQECWKPQMARGDGQISFTVSMPKFPVTETADSMGFGFANGTYRGYKTIFHAGVLFGYNTKMTLYPDMNLGIYTAFNGLGDEHEEGSIGSVLLHYFISDCILGLSQWLTPANIKNFPEPWMAREKCFIPRCNSSIIHGIPATRSLDDYAGTYSHGFLGDVSINVDTQIGVLNMYHGKTGQFKLHPNGEVDEFRIEGSGAMSLLHQLDALAPTDWLMVKFNTISSDNIDSLMISFYESNPVFKKSNLIMR